jgi:hypothetical protein
LMLSFFYNRMIFMPFRLNLSGSLIKGLFTVSLVQWKIPFSSTLNVLT